MLEPLRSHRSTLIWLHGLVSQLFATFLSEKLLFKFLIIFYYYVYVLFF